MDLGIKNKVAVVTASSKGLGFAVADRLYREGCKVAITARGTEDLNRAAEQIGENGEGEIYAFPSDVTKPDEINTFLDGVQNNLGNPDILVINAGGPPPGTFDSTSVEDWQKGFELNLLSGVNLIKRVLPAMRENHWGRILFMVSISAKQPLQNMILSNSIRAGVLGMAKTLADEVAADGVLVNSLLPGFIMTGRMKQVVKAQADNLGIPFEQRLEQLEAQIPVKRLGKPEEFANFAAFLVSKPASFVTGGVFLADGGMYRGLI